MMFAWLRAWLEHLRASRLAVGLRVLLNYLREQAGPFPPEPWRRG